MWSILICKSFSRSSLQSSSFFIMWQNIKLSANVNSSIGLNVIFFITSIFLFLSWGKEGKRILIIYIGENVKKTAMLKRKKCEILKKNWKIKNYCIEKNCHADLYFANAKYGVMKSFVIVARDALCHPRALTRGSYQNAPEYC